MVRIEDRNSLTTAQTANSTQENKYEQHTYPDMTKLLVKAQRKMMAKTVLVFNVKMNIVNSQNPHCNGVSSR